MLELELVLADAATPRVPTGQETQARLRRAHLPGALDAAPAALEVLHGGTPLYRSSLTPDRREALRPALPSHQQAGAGRRQHRRGCGRSAATEAITEAALGSTGRPAEVLAVSVQLEAEAARLEPGERLSCSRASASARAPSSGWRGQLMRSWAGTRFSRQARRSRGRGRSGPAPRRLSVQASFTRIYSGVS